MPAREQAVARRFEQARIPIALGLWAAAVALAPKAEWKLILIGFGAAAAVAGWILYRPSRWLYLVFFCLLGLPPIPAPGSDSGIHPAPLIAGIGLLIGFLRLKAWGRLRGHLPRAFGIFFAIILASVGWAAFYSGKEIAIGALARVVLFGLGVYIFAYTLTGDQTDSPEPFEFVRFLFVLATGEAIFACLDFYFHWPAPAGFGPQFVWVGHGVFRRAQGLFYEASTLGNFCAFFLMFILVCLFHPKDKIPIGKSKLLAAGAILATALILSYSRGSIINILVGAASLIWLRKGSAHIQRPRAAAVFCAILFIAAMVVRATLPAFSANYWSRIAASFQYASSSPDNVLSGRLTNWQLLGDFLMRQPWTAVFGIGYKTLPYSDYIGAKVVADNTYLQLLVETGIVGLISFLKLNASILQAGLRAARSTRTIARIFGEWIFCFWAGEAVQMLSGDLITYWRVLPLYFWVLAIAAREGCAP
jgi:O-antigen ligase